uniref:Uncharacterized protein n=1 Tax=Magallana gigas TaxID=29159 RepID=A0A8W8J1V1_MAGGI
MIFWKSCDKVGKYHSFKSYDEYTYITERNFKYSGVDQELSQYLRPWQPESSVLHLYYGRCDLTPLVGIDWAGSSGDRPRCWESLKKDKFISGPLHSSQRVPMEASVLFPSDEDIAGTRSEELSSVGLLFFCSIKVCEEVVGKDYFWYRSVRCVSSEVKRKGSLCVFLRSAHLSLITKTGGGN